MSVHGEGDLHLLCRIGGVRVAFPARAIEAIVKAETIVPVPGSPPGVRGLAAIRSRLLTVIDCGRLVSCPERTAAFMAIVTVAGHGYGLVLDEVFDVVELASVQPLPGKADAAWQGLDPMIADYAGELVLVVESERFIELSQMNLSQAA